MMTIKKWLHRSKRTEHPLLLLLLFSFLFTACSSSKFNIKTDPEGADVYFENPETRERKSLGKTPFEMRYKDINSGSSAFFSLLISKEGYIERHILIPDVLPFKSGSDVSMSLSLKQNPLQAPQPIDNAVWNSAIELLFDAQKLAMEKKLDPAIVKVKTAMEKTGGFHKAYTLLGSIYFLKKDYVSSLKNWEIAAKLNSKDQESAKMIQLLKRKVGSPQ